MDETAQIFALSFFQNRGNGPTQRELVQFWKEGHKKIEELESQIRLLEVTVDEKENKTITRKEKAQGNARVEKAPK